MKNITEISDVLDQSIPIVVISHPMPDGDAFGSMLGLAGVLENRGYQVQRVSPTSWGDFLDWMPDTDKIIDYSSDTANAQKILTDAKLIFCLDFNSPSRIGIVRDYVFKEGHITALIDHHLEPDESSFDYGVSEPEKSSTSEMVFEFIENMGWMDEMDEDAMRCLYTGMLTDTGSFRFPATSASVHRKVAYMKDRGLEHHTIHEELFDNNSENRMRFLGYLLSEKLVIIPEQHLAYVTVSQEEMERFQVQSFDLEGIVNMILSIKGVEVAALISERGDEVRLSLRSVGDIDVSAITRDYFNGGGHKNAAGGRSRLNLTETTEKFEKIMSN